MLKNTKALVQFVNKRLKDKEAVRCIDLSKMVEKLGSADYKSMKEQCLPVMAPKIMTMIYPRHFMVPFTGFEWTKLAHLTLPMLEDGPQTQALFEAIPVECPCLDDLEVKICERNLKLPIDSIFMRVGSTITVLRLNFVSLN